jgi:hypothetical protein
MPKTRTGSPPTNDAAPASAPASTRATATKPTTAQLSAYRPEDGYAAPTAEDRAVAQAIAVLREHGYGIACRCLDCNRPITAAASLARMRGRRCAERAGVTA